MAEISWSQVYPKDEDFTLYSIKEGLPDNHVISIEQDNQGYIWIGTSAGLSCFDGVHFTNYYKNANPSNSLGSDQIFKLLKRPDGKIYIGTAYGLSLLDPERRQISTYLVTGHEELSKVSNSFGRLTLLPNGNLVAGSGVGITVFNNEMKKVFEYVHYKKEDLGVKKMQFVNTLLTLSDGNCLIFGVNGLWLYNDQKRSIEYIQKPLLGIEAYMNMRNLGPPDIAVFQDPTIKPYTLTIANALNGLTGESNIDVLAEKDLRWMSKYQLVQDSIIIIGSHTHGFFYGAYDQQNLKVKIEKTRHFQGLHTNAIFEDQDKRIWIGTNYGLLGQSFTKQVFQHYKLDSLQKKYNIEPSIGSIIRFEQNFYMDLLNNGIWKFDLNLNPIKKINLPNGVWNIHKWTQDELFFGTQSQLYKLDPERPDDSVELIGPTGSTLCQFQDKAKNIWVGFHGGVFRYNPVTKVTMTWSSNDSLNFFPYNDAWGITETDSGYIWTCGEGFHRWNPYAKEWDRNFKWMPGTEGQEGHAFQITHLEKEDVIFCLRNNGLWKWNAEEECAEKIPSINRAFEFVEKIFPDPRPNCFWLVLRAGIGFINVATGQEIFFNAASGLPPGEVSENFYLDPETDTMYIGMDNGLLAFARADIEFTSKDPRVYITGIKLINSEKKFPAGIPVVFEARDRDFSIEFSSPEYEYASNIRYEYRLSDEAWSDLGNNQSVRFANLNAGSYNFDVRAISPYGAIGNTASMAITILPFYYETWWFKILILLCICALISLWFVWRLRELRKLEDMRQSIAADLHDEVGASLTSVQILASLASNEIPSENRKDVLTRLDLQAKKAGASLREIVWNIHPKNDVLEIFIGDLTRHAGEVLEEAGILYTITTDSFGPEEKLSLTSRQQMVRVFKEALSNLIRHSKATQSEITFRRENKMLSIMIRDNGKSFDPATSLSGNGLGNMAYRMKLINGDFNMQSVAGVGTKVTFRCKLK